MHFIHVKIHNIHFAALFMQIFFIIYSYFLLQSEQRCCILGNKLKRRKCKPHYIRHRKDMVKT